MLLQRSATSTRRCVPAPIPDSAPPGESAPHAQLELLHGSGRRSSSRTACSTKDLSALVTVYPGSCAQTHPLAVCVHSQEHVQMHRVHSQSSVKSRAVTTPESR